VDGALAWSARDLLLWFEVHLVDPGIMPRPRTVREAGAPVLALGATTPERTSLLLSNARMRVVQTLAGLVVVPTVDAFLNAAIFGGRVQRATVRGQSVWQAVPQEQNLLSDIVLSLFAADILSQRELYDASLAVCALCGRVSFERATCGRTGCGDHPAASHARSNSRLGGGLLGARVEMEADELKPLQDAWSNELLRALLHRTGWSCVGSVEVVTSSTRDTFKGYTDRHHVETPAGESPLEVLAAWRRTTEGHFIERALVHVNDALLRRAPASTRLEWVGDPWYDELDADAPIAVLGAPSDLLRVVSASRNGPVASLLQPCLAQVRPGVASALSGAGCACRIVAALSFRPGPGHVVVTILVEVRPSPGGILRRVDVSIV
jgi:hypothetical protein